MIDFREARLLDPKWWKRVRVLCDALERRTRAKAVKAGLDYHLALVANGSLTEESFEKVQGTAQERYFDLLGALRPWEGKGYLDRKQAEFRDWRQAYIDEFGVDPLDPAFKAWEAEQLAKLDAGEFDRTGPDNEAILNARLMERIMKGKA